MIFRRSRFRDVIDRQLAFLADEDVDLLTDVDEALERYNAADRDEAEELYGDYLLAIEAAAERAAELRDGYARTLADADAEEYVGAFNRAVAARWPNLGLVIEER